MTTAGKVEGVFSYHWRLVVRPHARQALIIALLMIGSSAFEMMTVGMAVPLIDVMMLPHSVHSSPVVTTIVAWLSRWQLSTSPNAIAFVLLVLGCFLFVGHSALTLVHQYTTTLVGHSLRRAMKTRLFERFLHAEYDEMAKRSRGSIVFDVNEPANAIYGTMGSLGQLCAGVMDCVFMIGLLLYLSWWATTLTCVVGIVGVQGWRRLTDRRTERYGRRVYELQREQAKLEVDALDGVRVVKMHGLEDSTIARQRALLTAERKPLGRVELFKAAPQLTNELVASVVVLSLGAVALLRPSLGLSFSALAAFLLAVRRLGGAMARVSAAGTDLAKRRRSLETIEEVLTEIPVERRGGFEPDHVDCVELNRVNFAYPTRPQQPVLVQVNLVLRRGTVTAIVGPTGAGKSTVASLLVGLYEPQSGSVRINGRDLHEVDLAAWRAKVGYVSQDVFVFNTTIRENIALGDERISVSEIVRAAGMAQLHDFVVALPQGYDTVVGDRGLRLSGGQCQRLAIARALLRRPDMLIFDEATSALDNLTERAVYNAISALRRDAVILIIAHRLSTVKDADHVVVLQAGTMVEAGTHETLMQSQGIYARLYAETQEEGVHIINPAVRAPEASVASEAHE